MSQSLDYGQPLPLMRQSRIRRWITVGLAVIAVTIASWITIPRVIEHRRKKQLALDAAAVDAAEKQDWAEMDRLFKRGASVNGRNDSGLSPLHHAVKHRAEDVTERLIKRGAAVDANPYGSGTPLHVAIGNADLKAIQRLLDAGANINQKAGNDTVLYSAIRSGDVQLVKFLIEHGADVNAQSHHGMRPLHTAVAHESRKALELLLAAGAWPDATDNDGDTPLMFTQWRNDRAAADALIAAGAKPTLWSAVAFGDLPEIQKHFTAEPGLLNSRDKTHDKKGKGLLALAASNGRFEVFAYLVGAGRDVTTTDDRGQTLLHEAAAGGDCRIIELLLNRGLNVNARDHSGQTPLHQTTFRGRLDAAKLLIERGAEVDIEQNDKITPLLWSISYRQPELASFLLSKGAKMRPMYLHSAVLYGDLPIVQFVVNRGVDVNARNEKGETPLQVAKHWNKTAIIDYLTARGAR